MEAPPGRYRVEEKDGRLVVIDNATGAPISSTMPPPAPMRGPGLSSAPIVEGRGAIDGAADFLLGIAVSEWDSAGRAVVHWKWKQNKQERRWDAALDRGQQRRLGRALLGLCAAPLLVLSFILLEGAAMWLGIALTLPPILWASHAIHRLQSETAGQMPPGGS